MAGTLSIGVAGTPPCVVFERTEDVADPLWNSLGRNIAPGASRYLDGTLSVPLERFLATRNWLAGALRTHQCHAEFSLALRSVLQHADAERAEIDALMSSTDEPRIDGDDVRSLLAASRFVRDLKSFQVDDLCHLLALSNGANFSVPGAGKTTVTYACYEAERARGRVDHMLVVAPLSAFEAWLTEADQCLSPAPVVRRFEERGLGTPEIRLINYQRLSSSYTDLAAWVAEGRCHLILDEAHRMKRGRNGEWGSACLNLAHLAARRDILTGTPAPQHPRDFVALIDFLWPHLATRVIPTAALRPDPPPEVMTAVSHRLGPLFVRTTKNQLGLDPPLLRVELVEMNALQAEIYQALRTRMANAVEASARERAKFGRMGEVVMYMLEAATNPALLATAIDQSDPSTTRWPPLAIGAESSLADKVRHYGSHEMPRKFEKLSAMVADNARRGRKTLVWSNFVTNIEELAERVLAPFEPAVVHGAVPSTSDESDLGSRESAVRRFREDQRCQVLIANPAAMSEGISLHDVCHDAVYLDRTFNAGHYLQSMDRIHRLGLPPGIETRVTFLVSRGTVDETVDDRVRLKAERLSEMLSDPDLVTMALPDEESYGEWIDPEDLDALFAHLRDE